MVSTGAASTGTSVATGAILQTAYSTSLPSDILVQSGDRILTKREVDCFIRRWPNLVNKNQQ